MSVQSNKAELGLALIVTFLLAASTAWAGRPWITDDAGVVGKQAGQLETWLLADSKSIEHWILPAVGPIAPLEISLGGAYGYVWNQASGHGFSWTFPAFQAKYLLREVTPGAWPGFAVVAGTTGPYGTPPFGKRGWDSYSYAAATLSPLKADRVLIHMNGGFLHRRSDVDSKFVANWGVATEVQLQKFYVGAEVFTGDPYAPSAGAASQVGARYSASDSVQIDGTIGFGLTGEPKVGTFGTLGVKLATERLW
jgi:hypothetical protein